MFLYLFCKTAYVLSLGISQRDMTSHYDFVEANQEAICRDILEFYLSKVQEKFVDDSCKLANLKTYR